MSEPVRRPIADLLAEVNAGLGTVDVGDIPAVLGVAWDGFYTAGAAGQLLAICADLGEYRPLWTNARPVLEAALAALRIAPSLPTKLTTEINPAGGPDDRLDDRAAAAIRARILDLAVTLDDVLPRTAVVAGDPGDAVACQQAAVLASELHGCYTGRLRSFLNSRRTTFGPGSFVVRGDGPRRRGPGPGSGRRPAR